MEIYKSETLELKESVVVVKGGKEPLSLKYSEGQSGLAIKPQRVQLEGVYVWQGTSSVPETDSAIRRMIKDTDGDSFEDMRSLEQNLTFDTAKHEFQGCGRAICGIQKC